MLDVRLKVDAAGVGAREHETAPSIEEHALEQGQHGVGRRVEILRRHLPAERHGHILQPVEHRACRVPHGGGVEAGSLVVDHLVVLQRVLVRGRDRLRARVRGKGKGKLRGEGTVLRAACPRRR